MSQYLLLKQGTIHNAVDEEAFVADILIEDGKIKKIAPVLEGKVINEAAVIDAMGIDVSSCGLIASIAESCGVTGSPSSLKSCPAKPTA